MRVITEAEVAANLSMQSAIAAVEGSFHRLAAGLVQVRPRTVVPTPEGFLAALCAVDEGLRLGSVKTYSMVDGQLHGFLLLLTSLVDGQPLAAIEADLLTRLRTGAASGVAAAALARPGAERIGIIGCGRQAPFQLDAVRRALPAAHDAIAWCRDPQRLARFCGKTGARPARHAREIASADVVITATTAARPVLQGAWLRPGALVIAIGGDRHGDRELDDEAVRRADLIVCDSRAASQTEAADLWAPVDAGLLSWGDVVELQDVVAGQAPGRRSGDDVVIFKSNGLGAWDLAAAAAVLDAIPDPGRTSGLP